MNPDIDRDKRLTAEELRGQNLEAIWDFATTAELPSLTGIIGQARAAKAFEFGLQIKDKGYNIFVSGLSGTGKATYAKEMAAQLARQEATPSDWVYVHNFAHPHRPLALELPPGRGRELVKDMEEFLDEIRMGLPKIFNGEDYERRRTELLATYQEESQQIIHELEEYAKDRDFVLKRTGNGFITLPAPKGKILESEEYAALETEEKRELESRGKEVQTRLSDALRQIRNLEKEAREKVDQLEREVTLSALGPPITELKEKYAPFPRLVDYFIQVQNSIIDELDDFKGSEGEDQSWPWSRYRSSPFGKYEINLLVDNSLTQGAPVIFETNPTYTNLFGKIEYRNEFGTLSTDFTMLKAGSVHRANGGYLIVQAMDLLRNYWAWEGLKRVLKNGEILIEDYSSQIGMLPMSTIKPKGIPVRLKIIILGNPRLYHLLYQLDEEFPKYFKIKADFDVEMPRNRDNLQAYAQFIGSYCRREGLPHFQRGAVAAIANYSSRLTGDRRKLSLRFNDITEIIIEAAAWARLHGADLVGEEHVQKALEEKVFRSNRWEERIQELLAQGSLLVEVSGRTVGQVNGLSVYDLGDYVFGKPSRITARTYLGPEGVINIEREVEMGGRIHNKGVLILAGYLAGEYAQDKPLALSASICFEQSYEGVEGDSASCAELCALLSSLADIPLEQGIAVTGSINQRGEMQPVGGITPKVEGFFAACRIKGFTGRQGVIIPRQNIDNLILRQEIVEAVEQGQFHIYAVGHVQEAMEILTGLRAGERQTDGRFPPGTINHLVDSRLEEMAEKMADWAKER